MEVLPPIIPKMKKLIGLRFDEYENYSADVSNNEIKETIFAKVLGSFRHVLLKMLPRR